jgi:hypothetical protein
MINSRSELPVVPAKYSDPRSSANNLLPKFGKTGTTAKQLYPAKLGNCVLEREPPAVP